MCVDYLEIVCPSETENNVEKDTPPKDFDKTIAAAEYHTRGLYSAVILEPKEHISENR